MEDQDQIINEIRRLNYSSNRLSVSSTFGGMQMSYKYLFDSYMHILDRHQKRKGEGIRWIINIDKENLNLVKVFLKAGIRIRHVKNMPPMNFSVSDKEMAGTIEKMEGGSMGQDFLFSNEPLYIDHFNSLFNEMWKNRIDVKVENKSDTLQTLKIQKLGFRLIKTALKEILVILLLTHFIVKSTQEEFVY